MNDRIEVEHRQVGPICVAEENVLHFDHIPGFTGAHRFALMEDAAEGPCAWLVCLDDLELAFRVMDPMGLFPDYDPLARKESLAAFAGSAREDLVVLAIVNLSDETPRLNLAAPLVVNARTKRGRQIVFDDTRFAMSEPLLSSSACRPPTPRDQIESNPQR